MSCSMCVISVLRSLRRSIINDFPLLLVFPASLAVSGFNAFSDTYWSSTQSSTGGGAWTQNFFYGYQNYNIKDSTYAVRAVRAF